jgi:hypothetical protein
MSVVCFSNKFMHAQISLPCPVLPTEKCKNSTQRALPFPLLARLHTHSSICQDVERYVHCVFFFFHMCKFSLLLCCTGRVVVSVGGPTNNSLLNHDKVLITLVGWVLQFTVVVYECVSCSWADWVFGFCIKKFSLAVRQLGRLRWSLLMFCGYAFLI